MQKSAGVVRRQLRQQSHPLGNWGWREGKSLGCPVAAALSVRVLLDVRVRWLFTHKPGADSTGNAKEWSCSKILKTKSDLLALPSILFASMIVHLVEYTIASKV